MGGLKKRGILIGGSFCRPLVIGKNTGYGGLNNRHDGLEESLRKRDGSGIPFPQFFGTFRLNIQISPNWTCVLVRTLIFNQKSFLIVNFECFNDVSQGMNCENKS